MLLSVCSSHCKSDHKAAAGQQHMGWLHFHLMHFMPTSPINLVSHAVSSSATYIFYLFTNTARMKRLNLNRYFVSLCTSYLFSNGSSSLCARLLRLQYFTLASETQEIINMTCQTIEHNDLSLIPLARESLMSLLQKIDLLHIGAALTWNSQSNEEWKYIKHMQR